MKNEKILQQHLPDAFKPAEMPTDWEDSWILVPVPTGEFEVTEATLGDLDGGAPAIDPVIADSGQIWEPHSQNIDPLSQEEDDGASSTASALGPLVGANHPGAPVVAPPGCPPPPDANAFYLPFHYYPRWWGIYLFPDGVLRVAHEVARHDSYSLQWPYYWLSARFFLYAHEFYHHRIESLASRLEVSHRAAAYRTGFQAFYDLHKGTDAWLEEGLANAYALQRIKKCFSKMPTIRDQLLNSYRHYIQAGQAGYRRGWDWHYPKEFKAHESKLAEESLTTSFPVLPKLSPQIWETGSFMTRGFGTIKSRIHYLIPRNKPLHKRKPLSI
ncbi:hypothetical protein N8505_03155 [Akkermansiaceae bacterium]|nr:hypothetical protein [Akkermansiaceae bacterium]